MATNHKGMTENVFPFLIEKLAENESQLETLDLLQSLFIKFGPIQDHVEVTLSAIQNEYFNRFQQEV